MNDDMDDKSQGFDIITYVVAKNHAIDVMIDDVVGDKLICMQERS